ncbi:MAG: ribonuclease P protein component [Phycisphaerales bacterium]
MNETTDIPGPRHFRARHRLSHARDYQAVFESRVRVTRGPLTLLGRPNDLPHCRLGLSIGRRFGRAHDRVRLKRMLREAFRLQASEWSPGYDLVVTARRHRSLPLSEYEKILGSAWAEIDRRWRQRGEGGGP